jgi:hypothetical protein
MPAKKKNRTRTSASRKRAMPLRSGASHVRRSPINGEMPTLVIPAAAAGRVIRVYAELPARLTRSTSPFEFFLEQWLVGPRVLAALQPIERRS